MDQTAFESDLRRDGFTPVFASLRPRTTEANHCHDFDARIFILGGEITITRDNKPETFRAGQCCEVPAGSMHAELVGPQGVAYLSGRRRGGPLTREAFESDLRREGFEVIHGGQKPNFSEEMHAHGDFDVRIMVLSGEITVNRDGGSTTFRAGDHCEIPGDCQHCTQVGPEGVAYIIGKVARTAAAN